MEKKREITIQPAPILVLGLHGVVRQTKGEDDFVDMKDIRLVEGIEEILWKYKNAGWIVGVITNEGLVAHGKKTMTQVGAELKATIDMFDKNPLDFIRVCYNDPTGTVPGYNFKNLARKPHIGMLVASENEWFQKGYLIAWDASLYVGAYPEDQECAENADIRFMYIDKFLQDDHSFTFINEDGDTVPDGAIPDAPTTELVKPLTISKQDEYESCDCICHQPGHENTQHIVACCDNGMRKKISLQ